jgi:hypothetical protein
VNFEGPFGGKMSDCGVLYVLLNSVSLFISVVCTCSECSVKKLFVSGKKPIE